MLRSRHFDHIIAESPSHPPCGHLLPPGEKGAGAPRANEITNRRKWCALTLGNAHNGALGVRVGALTNKAAHYLFHLVRTAWCALFGLTSISGTATCRICRRRRGAAATRLREVRIFAPDAHRREEAERRTAHFIADAAHENATIAQLARGKMPIARGSQPIFGALRPSVRGGTSPAPFVEARVVLRILVTLLLAASCWAAGGRPLAAADVVAKPASPNIVFILADDK